MRRLAWSLAVLGLLIGVTGLSPALGQGEQPLCPGDARCVPLSAVRITGARAISSYPVFRNPMLILEIEGFRGAAGSQNPLLYVDRFKQIGGDDSAHCHLIVVGLADENDRYAYQLALDDGRDRTSIRVFAFCREINLPDDRGVLPFPGRYFPREGTVIDVAAQSLVEDDAGLWVLVENAVAGRCPLDRAAGEPAFGLSSFRAQLAVFVLYHRDMGTHSGELRARLGETLIANLARDLGLTPLQMEAVVRQQLDQMDAWRLFEAGGQTDLAALEKDVYCLLTDFADNRLMIATPFPTHTPTPTPTATPLPGQVLTPTPTPLWDASLGSGGAVREVFGATLGDLLLRAGLIIVAAVVLLVLVSVRRLRIAALVVAVLLLLALAVWLSTGASESGHAGETASPPTGIPADMPTAAPTDTPAASLTASPAQPGQE